MTAANALNITSNGLQIFNPATGAFSPFTFSAKGDLMVFDGTNYQVLTVGQDGDVLKADSSQSLGLKWDCTGYEFLSSQTVNNVANVDFSALVDDRCYSGYRFLFKNLTFTGSSFNFGMRFSIDGGSTFLTTGYRFARRTGRADSTEVTLGDTTSNMMEMRRFSGGSSSDVDNSSGDIIFYESSDPSGQLYQGVTYQLWGTNTGAATISGSARGAGTSTTSSTVNGFQFIYNTGNIEHGEFYMYGILKQ